MSYGWQTPGLTAAEQAVVDSIIAGNGVYEKTAAEQAILDSIGAAAGVYEKTAGEQAVLDLMSASGSVLTLQGDLDQQLQDITDWTTLPAPWVRLNPSGTSQLTRADSHVFAPGSMTIKANHEHSKFVNDHIACPVGIGRPLRQRHALFNLDLGQVVNHGNLVGATYAWLTVGLMWNRGDHLGAWAGAWMEYKNAAVGGAGDPYWHMQKVMKLPNVTTDQASSKFNLNEVDATSPTDPGMRFQWSQDNGFRAWGREDNGDLWTELGGGAVATGWVDPTAATADQVGGISTPSDLVTPWLFIVGSVDFNIAAAGDSVQFLIDAFNVESQTL